METLIAEVSKAVNRPPRWKKHHRWQWGWQKFLGFVDLIDRIWPRNP